jgi:hypothetical protein
MVELDWHLESVASHNGTLAAAVAEHIAAPLAAPAVRAWVAVAAKLQHTLVLDKQALLILVLVVVALALKTVQELLLAMEAVEAMAL